MTTDPTDTPRCTATAKGTGERCKRRPIPGGTVCVKHGGGAPAVRAAAEQRLAEQGAEVAVRKIWAGLDQATPVKDPVASMERLAGALEQMVDEAGRRVSELQHLAGGKDLTQLRAEVTLLERALGHLRSLLADMARLGIAERHVQLEQQRVAMVTAAFRAAVGVLQLVPADRDLVVRRFLTELGVDVPAALEAGGAA